MTVSQLTTRDYRKVRDLRAQIDKLAYRYYNTTYKSKQSLLSQIARLEATIDYIYKRASTDNNMVVL